MAVTMVIRDKDTKKFFISTTGGYTAGTTVEFKNQRAYHFLRFKHFYVAFDGESDKFLTVISNIDFDSIAYPLNKRSVYEEIFYPMMHILVDKGFVKLSDDGIVNDFGGNFSVISEDTAYDFSMDGKIHEVRCFSGLGFNSASYVIGRCFYDKMNAKELGEKMISNEIKYNDRFTYPIITVDVSTNIATRLYEDGHEEKEEIKEMWRREE